METVTNATSRVEETESGPLTQRWSKTPWMGVGEDRWRGGRRRTSLLKMQTLGSCPGLRISMYSSLYPGFLGILKSEDGLSTFKVEKEWASRENTYHTFAGQGWPPAERQPGS